VPAPEDIKRQLAEMAHGTGPWTSHNIEVASGVFTVGPQATGDEPRVRTVTQLAADLSGRPLDSLRVLDLAALEGHFGIELALHGAEVVLVEGREQHADKIRFAIDALGIQQASVRTEDVRTLSRSTHGQFDVVLCLGLLYHLDQDGLFGLLRAMREVCTGVLIVDTHIAYEDGELGRYPREEFGSDPYALSAMREVEVAGQKYRGRDFQEHDPGASHEQRLAARWRSLDNVTSLWLTRPSLINALLAAGFTSVLEPVGPYLHQPVDRPLVVALGRERISLRSTSLLIGTSYEFVPEGPPDDTIAPAPDSGAHRRRCIEWTAQGPPARG
jgi:hypothetical protein